MTRPPSLLSSVTTRRVALAALSLIVTSLVIVHADAPPVGYTDYFDGRDCHVSGWARDSDSPATALTVRAYRTAPADRGGILIGTTAANYLRLDGLPGYTLALPVGFDDAVFLYATGVDANGQATAASLLPLYTPTVPARHVTCDTALDNAEGPTTVGTGLGFSLTLGAIDPLMNPDEGGVVGATPDGRTSAVRDGASTQVFFTCSDGIVSQSCLTSVPSVGAFSNLSGLLRDPTGALVSVMEPGEPGDPYQSQYAGLASTWRDPATGIIHGWYHAEIPVTGCAFGQWASIGYAVSTDGGATFTKLGPVITSPVPMQPNAFCGQGVGEPNVIPASDGYLYMLYDFADPLTFGNGGMSVARAPQASPTQWMKYGKRVRNTPWSQPGIGGLERPVILLGDAGQQSWFGGVSYNTALQKYLLFHSDYNHEGNVYLRTSPDLIAWSAPQLVMAAGLHAYRYPTFLGADDKTTAGSGWLYVTRKLTAASFGASWMARRPLSLVPAAAKGGAR